MKSNSKKIVILLILGLVFPLILNYNFNLSNDFKHKVDKPRTSATYEYIIIDALATTNTTFSGNWSWARAQPWCTTGDGTKDYPYIIENVTIIYPPSIDCLTIRNSRKYFIVRNCTFKDIPVASFAGLRLNNVTNGKIVDNQIYNNTYGITCSNVNNSQFIDNNCSNNLNYGMYFDESDNNTISGNTANGTDDGIHFHNGCDNNTISGNTANDNNYEGLSMYDGCDFNNITGNTANNNMRGIWFEENNDNTLSGNTANNNTDGGMYLYANCRNTTVSGNTANNNGESGIYLDYLCNNNTITGNTANNNTDNGIYLWHNSDNNTISGNTANNNSRGIYLENNCDNNTLSGNTANNNSRGIHLNDSCNNNTLYNNTANDNTNEGIYLDTSCSNNILSGNTADGNDVGIYLYDNCDYNDIIDNTANNNKKGIYLDNGFSQCTNNRIINNTANNNSEMGIYSHICSNNNFTGNTVNDNGHRGIFIEGSNFCYIINNTANRNGEAGISIYNNANDNTLINNIATDNTKYGIEVYNSHNNDILNNTANRNGGIGIYLSWGGCDSNTITGNIVNDNSKIGIFLYLGCDSNNIKNNTINRNSLGIGLKQDSNSNTISDNLLIDNGMCIFELGCIGNIIENNTCSGSFKQLPIFINGTATGVGAHNWTWVEQQSWFGGGSGTKDIPYIIENLNRDGLAMTNCIEIINSNVYFIVRNCTFYNSGSYSAGIRLDNVSNGTLTENNCSFNYMGIVLGSNCEFNNITGNIAKNNDNRGISLGSNCDFNNITGNIANNNTNSGVHLSDQCDNNTISQNIVSHNGGTGIFLSGGGMDSSYNNTFLENTAENNDYGIQLEGECHFNKILRNNIKNNNFGINLEGSGSSNNSIYQNFFLENGKHAEDDGTDNKWNSTTFGNYWDNHTGPDLTLPYGIVDLPYNISGTAGSKDYLPIAEDGAPQITINTPNDDDVFGTNAPSYNVTITDDYLDEMWYTLDGGLHNYTFTGFTGTVNQSMWDVLSDGIITLIFYASDKPRNIGSAEVNIIKDTQAPTITVNSPEEDDIFGISAPFFNVRITDDNLDTMWYTLNSGLNNYTFTDNGTINPTAWAALLDEPVTIIFYANDTLGHLASAEITIIKDTHAPTIVINSPSPGSEFGVNAPAFVITITDDHLDSIWYSLDGGVTTYAITTNATIDQTAWTDLSEGSITITFYANDTMGNLSFEEVTITKNIPSDVIDPTIVIVIVVVSVVGGVAVIAGVYIFMKKRATPE